MYLEKDALSVELTALDFVLTAFDMASCVVGRINVQCVCI